MLLFSNNAETTLPDGVTGDDEDPDFNTIIVAADGTAGAFGSPSASAGSAQLATLTHPSMPGEWEIVRITDRQDNVFTVERGVETPYNAGVGHQAWPAGAKLSARITAGTLQVFPQLRDQRFLVVQAADGGQPFFSLASFPALSEMRSRPTDGYYYGGQDQNFAVEIAGSSQPVNIGVVPTWQSNGYYPPGSVVAPVVPDGFQYWFDPLYEGAYAQTSVEPEFAGDSGVTEAFYDGYLPDVPVGFWVPTPMPVDTTLYLNGSGAKLVLSEVGFIATSAAGEVTAPPIVSIGDADDPTRFADHVALSQITQSGHIHRIPVSAGGAMADRLTLRVDTPAAGGSFRGRFYWRGFFIET